MSVLSRWKLYMAGEQSRLSFRACQRNVTRDLASPFKRLLCALLLAAAPSPLFAAVPPEQVVENGVGFKLFQRAVDKAIAAIPTVIDPEISRYGLHFVFTQGETDVLGCTLGYELGVDDVEFKVDLRPPTSMSLKFLPDQTVKLDFDIRMSGSAYPYASGNFCGWEPDAGPTVSASNLYGTMTLVAQVIDGQMRVFKADVNVGLGSLDIDLGPISWLLDTIGLHDEFNNWIRDLAMQFASDMASEMLPGMIEAALRDKLKFETQMEGFDLHASLNEMTTDLGSLTLRANTGLFPSTPEECPTGGTCISMPYAAGASVPADHAVADAGITVSLPTINQAMFGAFRSGKMKFEDEMDAAEVLGAMIPGLPISGIATVSARTLQAPNVAFADATSTDPRVSIGDIEAHIVVPGDSTFGAIDLTIRTSLTARAIVELTPPYLGEDANPDGNRIQVRMAEFELGETTLFSGPQSGLLTDAEKQALLDLLVLPMYESKVGILPIASTILDFKLPNTNRRAALRVLEKQRMIDAVAVFVEFAISPLDDTEAPSARITKVAGKAPNLFTREVLIAQTEAIVQWTGSDDRTEYEPYITFQSSDDGSSGWVERNFIRAVKLQNLKEGANWFYVRARDFANNLSIDPTTPAGQSGAVRIVVDTLPPQTSLKTAPQPFINTTSALVAFAGNDSGTGVKDYAVSIDGGEPVIAASANQTLMGLAEGAHTVLIKARDRVGNVDPDGAIAEFTVDLTAPVTRLAAPRTGYVKPSAARFSISANDNLSPLNLMQYGYQVEGPACASGSFTEFSLVGMADLSGCAGAEGVYTVRARAKDAAGNVDSAGVNNSFTMDGTLPTIQLLEHPSARTTDKQLRFLVAGSDNYTAPGELAYSYRLIGLDGSYSVPQVDPYFSLDQVPSGDYIFEVRANDLADNFSERATFAFSLDNLEPTTELTGAVSEYNTDIEMTLPVSGHDDRSQPEALRYAVTVDGHTETFGAPVVLRDIAEGFHVAHIAAVDEFDNRDERGVSVSFTVDRTAPNTTLARAINRLSLGQLRPSIGGSDNLTAESDLRYSYRVTRPGMEPTQWSTPVGKDAFVVSLRERGPVTLELAAVDNAGLFDSSPLVIKANVQSVTGCDCSSTDASESELGFAALATLFFFARRRRTKR